MGKFDKFAKAATEGAKKKEKIKQDKRKAKKEQEAFFKKKKETLKSGSSLPQNPLMEPHKPGKKNSPSSEKASFPSKKRDEKSGESSGHESAGIQQENMPLNKYIAHSGLCSRRDAAILVKDGEVQVNGKVEKEPGYKIQSGDIIKVKGNKVTPRQQMVYILLNKPKDFITTAEDDKGRKTVLDIVKNATTERIFPVGRLDRNTTGVLLLTNDGDLTQHLTHPSFEVRKIYEVTLDKVVAKADLEQLLSGIKLEDGLVAADAVGYADNKDKSVVGIEIHSGKNRVVRRMFEHLGYDVRALDRVMFANLTKKNVDRGKWRFLAEKEVRLLKFFNKSKRKDKEDKKPELQDTPFQGKTSSVPKPKRVYAPESPETSFPKKSTREQKPFKGNQPEKAPEKATKSPRKRIYKK